MENDTLIVNAFDEYYIYKRQNGTFYIRYSRDFYEKHCRLMPEFSISDEEKFTEELSPEECMDFIKDTADYYGKDCILDEQFKKSAR